MTRKWQGIIAEFYTIDQFVDYLAAIDGAMWSRWHPTFLVLHHTANPSLFMYPSGITRSYLRGATGYYRDELGWSAGPHFFVDDHGVWLFTPMWVPGVHAKSFNANSLGIEMLGNYDVEDPNYGRGSAVLENAIKLIAILSLLFNMGAADLAFHRDEPSTTKSCPGELIDKADIITRVKKIMAKAS